MTKFDDPGTVPSTIDTAPDATDPVRIQVMSDLHLETPRFRPMYDDFTVIPRSPYLALLGDIGCVHDKGLFSFLERQLQQFEIVFYVLGNHEPYMPKNHSLSEERVESGDHISHTHQAAVSIMEQFEEENKAAIARAHTTTSGQTPPKPGRFILLNRRRFDLSNTITILGTTLFSQISTEQRAAVSVFVSDFSNIQDWTVDTHNALHAADIAWLNDEVETIARENDTAREHQDDSPQRSLVVLTHYSPTVLPQANDPEHQDDDRGVSSAFVTDLSEHPCWKTPCVKAWVFGHTHFNCDFVDNGKRVVANQRGYGREDAFDFDADKVIAMG